MINPKISKTTIEPGWAEVRMTMPRPVPDVPDFKVSGEEARIKMAKTMLAFVAGLARTHARGLLEEECIALAYELGMFPRG